MDRGPLIIPRDTHPTPELHDRLAAALVVRIGATGG